MKKLTAIVLATALTSMPLGAQEDGPAALVIRVQGQVQVAHGGDAPNAAAVGEQVFVGDRVIPASGSRAILITRTGAQQVVSEETTMSAPRGAGNPDIFERAMATLAQAASTDATAGGRQGMIRPIPGRSSLVAPRNRLAIASPRPTFTWTATPDETYELMLRKVDGGQPVIFEVGTDTTWTLPDDAPDLEYGSDYSWTVFVGGRRGGRPLPQQEFRVISLEESVEMEDYLDEISVFGLDPMGDGLFLTVMAYRDMDLFYEAREALVEVERENSLSPDLYMLMGEVLSELGHEEEAREAFDKADELLRG